ncbi:MAG: phosphoribosylformylglycinamidine cyclo-ligase [Actinobacteria bacterium]|nr:phosphoribosylformylglycinamidine cyclo-ligase [Actinomycetota bacterium]MDQ3533254.1 phosphoribosylformylglycinamidine cyclo-ligase [Actinomycetota bacterium]
MSGRYEEAGVRGQGAAASSVLRHLGPTLGFPDGAEVITGFGHYASVLKVADEVALAISTDGVGSKTLIASALDRYDTIGFDCVAMNVNDVLCVGASPIAMVDYLGVNTLEPRRAEAVLRGLAAAASEAGIAIPGGEIAQLPEVIGPGEAAFDLVGTCVGVVHPDRLVLGADVQPGDAIIGIASSGIHSNGLTLARRVLLSDEGDGLGAHVDALGRSVGEELLEPTVIYAGAVRSLQGLPVRGFAHITSDGLANLCRLEAPVGYNIETLPSPPPIFSLIQEAGAVEDAEMFRVFNMGVGFVVIVEPREVADALGRLGHAGYKAARMGAVSDAAGRVVIEPVGLVGSLNRSESAFSSI